MDNRITVSKMKSQLENLEKEGHGDKFIFVGGNYICDKFNISEETWSHITYDEIHHSDVPITEEQEKSLKKDDMENKIKSYIKYLDNLKKKGRLSDWKYDEMIKTIIV